MTLEEYEYQNFYVNPNVHTKMKRLKITMI
jgi:hypothetical protein